MTDDRDPLLQSLFTEAQPELDGEAFTAAVMARTRFLRYRLIAPWLAGAMVVAVCVLFFVPLQAFALLLAQGLAITIVDLGDSWVAWVLSPINSVASVIVLGVKAVRMGMKRVKRLSYA